MPGSICSGKLHTETFAVTIDIRVSQRRLDDQYLGQTLQEDAPIIQRRRKRGMKRGVNIVTIDSNAPPSAHIASQHIIQ